MKFSVFLGITLIGMAASVSSQQLNESLEFVYPNVDSKSNGISITVQGLFLDKKVDAFNPPSSLVGDLEKVVIALNKHVNANKTKDIDKILETWSESDKSNIRDLFSDEKMLENSNARFQALSNMNIISVFHYDSYIVALIDHKFINSHFSFHYVFVVENGMLRLTNKLSADQALNGVLDLLLRAEANNINGILKSNASN
jgi:hypothetical protein